MTMEVIEGRRAMQERADRWRQGGHRIGFVPTMGFLHDGHLQLLRAARDQCDQVVLSIYVNPTQFGPMEDLDRYPRNPEGDLLAADSVGTDVVFMPGDLYGPGFQTSVEVRQLSEGLCGTRRPGHFAGVALIVTKLFHIVKPHVAYFGEKDYQQLQVVRRLVADLDMDIDIRAVPIQREPDGLAMSSRNAYLGPEERAEAVVLSRALDAAEELVAAGERRAGVILARVREVLGEAKGARVDYTELRDANTLVPLETIDAPVLVALAVHFGGTRLIDNRVLRPPV